MQLRGDTNKTSALRGGEGVGGTLKADIVTELNKGGCVNYGQGGGGQKIPEVSRRPLSIAPKGYVAHM